MRLKFEIRVWARNEKERDELTEQVYNQMRSNQFGGGSSWSDDEELHDFRWVSGVPVDELGEEGIKSMVLNCEFMFALGA